MSTAAVHERRSGWITVAAILMLSIGFLRIISAISYFSDSKSWETDE